MNRFDIPKVVTAMIDKAVEIELIDASDILALGGTFSEDFDGLVAEIIDYAYSNIHVNDDHDIMAPFSDSYHQWKQASERMSKVDDVEVPDDKMNDFDTRFMVFFEGCVTINRDYMALSFPSLKLDKFSFKKGRRYMKVVREGSVHCFVDTTTGDVLKAASWSAPAKHARGNIFDEKNGLGWMGEYGPAYLR